MQDNVFYLVDGNVGVSCSHWIAFKEKVNRQFMFKLHSSDEVI